MNCRRIATCIIIYPYELGPRICLNLLSGCKSVFYVVWTQWIRRKISSLVLGLCMQNWGWCSWVMRVHIHVVHSWVVGYKVGWLMRELCDGSPLKQEQQHQCISATWKFQIGKNGKHKLSKFYNYYQILYCGTCTLYSALFTCSLLCPYKSHPRPVLMTSHLGKLPSSHDQPWSLWMRIDIAS